MSHHSTTGPQKRCGLLATLSCIQDCLEPGRSLLKLRLFLVALPHFPQCWVAGGSGYLSPSGPWAFSGAQSMSKGSHASHTGLLSAPPAHYNVPAWGLLDLNLPQSELLFHQIITRLAPYHSSVSPLLKKSLLT